MNRFLIMAIAQAIAAHEHAVFGDSCLITQLTQIIRDEVERPAWRHAPPVLDSAEGDPSDA